MKIFNNLVKKLNCFYRRYSDDIIVICNSEQADYVESYVNQSIQESKVEMSEDKTERFIFKNIFADGQKIIKPIKITSKGVKEGIPFAYLGFEFHGEKTLVKSANLAKFYRRMIHAVKVKTNRAIAKSQSSLEHNVVIYKRQLQRMYNKYPLSNLKAERNFKRLVKNDRGEFFYKIAKTSKPNRSNFLAYIHRASEVMNDEALKKQIRNHSKIFNQALSKHLKRAKAIQHKNIY